MGIFNYLEYDGANSLDNGVYISGEGAYNAPERAVEKISIPGRNGDLIIDRGRFENVEVSYPAGVFGSDQSEFAAKVRAYRNKLASSRSYKRLTDSYHPDEFRLALFKDGLEVEPANYNRAGEFDIVFDCKPQRFLISGETPVSYPRSWGQTETASGDPAVFSADESTGIKSLEVDLEPIQDLNGYDRPWVGGAGKNLCMRTLTSGTLNNGIVATVNDDGSIKLTGTANANLDANLVPTGTVVLNNAGTYILSGCPSGGSSSTYQLSVRIKNSGGTTLSYPADVGSGVTFTLNEGDYVDRVYIQTISGVTYNQTFYPMIRKSTQSATYEPYENVCPISGHSEVETHRTGRNLLPYPYVGGSSLTNNGITFTAHSDGSVTANGTATANAVYQFTANASGALGFLPSGRYIVSGCPSGGSATTYEIQVRVNGTWKDVGATELSVDYVNGGGGVDTVRIRVLNGQTVNNLTFYPMIRLATDTDSTYEPYQGDTYTTDLGRTVYGGTLDIVSGVLTVDRAMVDLGTLTWTRNTSEYSYAYFYSNGFLQYSQTPLVCSHYPFASGGKAGLTTDKTMAYYSAASTRMTIRDDSYTDATSFATAMSGVQCVYPLLTPQTYQLTPQEVEALVGENVVWSDGSVTVQYGEDPEKIVNPTLFPSNPLIALTGSGTVTIGDTTITSTAPTGTTVYIDCESKEIYYYLNGNLTNGSTFISFSGNDFPVIEAGAPKVTRTGTIGIVITPRWWLV